MGMDKNNGKQTSKHQVKAKIRDMQFAREIPLWIKGREIDSNENYILLRAMDCNGKIGLVMWRTTAKREKLGEDVILVGTNYTSIDGKKRLVRKVDNCDVYGEIVLGGMYNLDKDRGYIRVDNQDEVGRAGILADVISKYDKNVSNTEVEQHILKEVDREVHAMVHHTVLQKASKGAMGYYCLVLTELCDDKKMNAKDLVHKWSVWDKNVTIAEVDRAR